MSPNVNGSCTFCYIFYRKSISDDIRSSGFAHLLAKFYFGPLGPVLRTIAKWPPDFLARDDERKPLNFDNGRWNDSRIANENDYQLLNRNQKCIGTMSTDFKTISHRLKPQ